MKLPDCRLSLLSVRKKNDNNEKEKRDSMEELQWNENVSNTLYLDCDKSNIWAVVAILIQSFTKCADVAAVCTIHAGLLTEESYFSMFKNYC